MTYSYEMTDEGNIKRTDDSGNVSFVPLDPNNRDYKEYLKTLEQ